MVVSLDFGMVWVHHLFERLNSKRYERDVYACFLDCVKHDKLIDQATGIDKEEIIIISQLYWHQRAEVKVEQSTSEAIIIKRGVRQGCILSPLLFNLYSETIFREALQGVQRGIKINGVIVNNLRYADDCVVLADNLADLQDN